MFELFDAYYVKKQDDGKNLILLISRVHFPENEEELCGVDPYYMISQSAHSNADALIEDIKSLGYFAERPTDIFLKKTAVEMGVAFAGMNTICVIDGFGSFFQMEAVRTDMPLDEKLPDQKPVNCSSCGRCAAACPTGAITPDGFDRHKCLRNYMMGGQAVPVEMREAMGSGLVGCSICRDACPYNEGVKLKDLMLPSDFFKAFSLEELLEPEGVSPWQKLREEVLGSNMVRRERLCAQAILIAANTKRYDLLEKIVKLKDHKNPVIAEHAAWAIEKLDMKG